MLKPGCAKWLKVIEELEQTIVQHCGELVWNCSYCDSLDRIVSALWEGITLDGLPVMHTQEPGYSEPIGYVIQGRLGQRSMRRSKDNFGMK